MQASGSTSSLTLTAAGAGRAALVQRDGTLYAGRGYAIHRSTDDGATWSFVAAMPRPLWRRAAERSRLACRLLRQEVRALAVLADGGLVAANREGVYWAAPGQACMQPGRIDGGPEDVRPPMCLTRGPDDRVLCGEYWGNATRREVYLFASDDGGRSFHVARTFAAGEIRHVHNIVYDETAGHYWVLSGDHVDEPGIGRLSADLASFEWLVKGEQRFRAVCVFDLGDRLVYGTDTETASNHVMSLDKQTGRAETVAALDGSCIYACRFGGVYALTTTVEPSTVNRTRDAALWLSRDAATWHRAYVARKDVWPAKAFQYGSLVLPRGESDRETLACSGQALRGLDGRVWVASLAGVAT